MAERGPRHETQLAFEFLQKPKETPSGPVVRGGILSSFDSREPGLGRFIRSVEHDVQIQTPALAANFLMQQVFTPFDEFTQEELYALMLNTQEQDNACSAHLSGHHRQHHVRNAEIYRPAIQVNARSIMPRSFTSSGDPTPSPSDVAFTASCAEAGRILDVDLVDHIIVGRTGGFHSKNSTSDFGRRKRKAIELS